ncbi:MAG: hypothetical protein JWQ03_3163 [Variovorax sp.]|nr:hypothetical protein [Variovorax sp.]
MRKSILLSVLASVALMFSMAAYSADHFKPEGFGSIPAVQAVSKDSHASAPAAAVQSIKVVAPAAPANAARLSVHADERPGASLSVAPQPSFVLKQPGIYADRGAEGRERKFAI